MGKESSWSTIPAHRPLTVPGVHAYPLEHSVRPGEDLELAVSSDAPYRLSIRRLGVHVDDDASDDVLEVGEISPAACSPIHPGSYVHVEHALGSPLSAVTFDCWVRPWAVTGEVGLITQHDRTSGGVGICLGRDGRLQFHLGVPGEGLVLSSPPRLLEVGRWYHVAATWNGIEAVLWRNGDPVASQSFSGPVDVGTAPLRIAAWGSEGVAEGFLDGDVASPRILGRAITRQELEDRVAAFGLDPPVRSDDLLAHWPFDEEKGEEVRDVSAHARSGRIINRATWMVGGPGFDRPVPRFAPYEPEEDMERGHGLRFASDDLYDCRWPVAHRWAVPSDARSGFYVARLEYERHGETYRYDCTFIVRRSLEAPRASIVAVASTNTWRAYNATPFAQSGERHPTWLTQGLKNEQETELPAFSFYRPHSAGQPTYQVGLRMPWPSAAPSVIYGHLGKYSHLMRAERFALAWLESQGYEVDVISDLDLHRDHRALDGYATVLVNGHSEYWSLQMFDAMDSYLSDGGTAVVLSGNSVCYRVSFDHEQAVMECRKVDLEAFKRTGQRRGEAWHSHDGLRGGKFREFGRPGWLLVGLDIIGVNDKNNPKSLGWWVADRVDHPLFHHPEETGLEAGHRFGWTGAEGVPPMAHVHEVDVRPSTHAALLAGPIPEGVDAPADPPGMVRLANGFIRWSEGGRMIDYFGRRITEPSTQGGEMIYWERPTGGRVFNAGTIGSGWVLSVDEQWGALLRNVLAHFGVPRPG